MSLYLLSVHAREGRPGPPGEVGGQETRAAHEATLAFDGRLREAGRLVFAQALEDPSTATVVDATGAEPVLTDGPCVEAEEHLAGLWIIDASDLDVALRAAAEGSRACGGRVEVRPFRG